MAVKIRLTRMGRKKRPFYRIVALDSRKRRDGAYLEKIGHYDPITRPAEVNVDHEIAIKWLQRGAQISDTVKSLFRREGIMLRWDMTKRGYEAEKIEEAVSKHLEKRYGKLEKEVPAKPEPEPEEEVVVEEPKPEAKEEKPEEKAEEAAEEKAEEKPEEKAEEAAEEKAEEKAEGEEKAE